MSTPTFLGPLIGKGVGQCELVNAERGSVLASHVEPAFDSKTRTKGLLGRDSIPDDYAMIIAPCSAVHTFGMRTPLDLVFVAKNGTITKTCRGVQPWRMAGSLRAHAVVEAAPGFIDRHEIVPGEMVALREIPNSQRPMEAMPIPGSTHRAEPGAAPARRTTRRRVTLADLIARKTPLAWFEAVAVVQELCETVLAREPANDPRVPELKHIVLTAEGNVTLLSEGPSGHSPVQRAGLVLLALTPEEQLPMQLRLLTLEEVSPRPKLSSLKDLHRELEFFERPDRQSIVREVYERFQLQSSAAAVESAVPAPLLEPPPVRRHGWWKRKAVRAGSAVLALVLLTAAAAWEWRRPEGERFRQPVAQFAESGAALARRAAAAASREFAVLRTKLGLTAAKPVAPPPVAIGGGRAAPAPVQPRAGIQAGLPARPQPVEPPAAAGTEPVPPAAGALNEPAPPPKPRDVLAAAEVFSAEDPLVAPPHLVRPALRTVPRSGTRMEDLPELENPDLGHGRSRERQASLPRNGAEPGDDAERR